MSGLRIALAQINSAVGEVTGNGALISAVMQKVPENTDLVVFPEMCLSGYPLMDLVNRTDLLRRCREVLQDLAQQFADGPAMIVGCPWQHDGQGGFLDRTYDSQQIPIYNAVILLQAGEYHWIASKFHLPNEGIFDEKRQFAQPDHIAGPIKIAGARLGAMVCHDMWFSDVTETQSESGAELMIAINASPIETDKQNTRFQACLQRVVESKCPMIMVNQIGAQDGVVFDGTSFVIQTDYRIALQLPSFKQAVGITDWQKTDQGWQCIDATTLWSGDDLIAASFAKPALPNIDADSHPAAAILYQIAGLALRDFVHKNDFQRVVLGLSGGVDSALVATIAADYLGSEHVHAVLLPSPYTAQQSLDDAQTLAGNLGISTDILPIAGVMQAFDQAVRPAVNDGLTGIAAENIQARIRGSLLMSIANQSGAMLLSTGNKSEIAVGYCTLYGDMCGAFNPIADLYKTEVYVLCDWRNQSSDFDIAASVIPQEILERPPSAELAPNQRDSDSLPDYAVLDDVLHCIIEKNQSVEDITAQGYDRVLVLRVLRLLDQAQHKRTQAAIGAKVSLQALKSQWRYPINNRFTQEFE